jgi:very-short-patch-repair endonuclease
MEKKRLVDTARKLRQTMTDAEEILWKHLRAGKIKGIKFRRQHPVGSFVLDFYWAEVKLAIEIDGEIHKRYDIAEYDVGRTFELDKLGIRLIRFTNEEVKADVGKVVSKIIEYGSRPR